jgi:hypothetical protein
MEHMPMLGNKPEQDEAKKKLEEMIVDPSTGLLTKKEWTDNPNA